MSAARSFESELPHSISRLYMKPMSPHIGCSELMGIALVVDDIHKGCNLAFRYPCPPASAALDHVSSFHKLSAPLIAKLFRPKNALCNESFELVIDDLRFITHPVLVPRRTPTAGAISAPAVQASTSSTTGGTITHGQSSPSPHESDTTMFNVIFALDERQQQPSQRRQFLYMGDASLEADGEEVDANAGDSVKRSRRWRDSDGYSEEARLQHHKQRIAAFRNIAAQLANGLLHEELRAGFVSREVRELLHIRDELLQNERMLIASSGPSGGSSNTSNAANTTGGSGNASSANGGSGGKDGVESSGQSVLEVDPQTLIDVALEKSVLANDLKRVYHGLEENGMVHVVINHWVKLSLTLTDSVALKMQNLRPYQTLLLLTDDDTVLNALPTDHSNQLRALVTAASPLKSFQDLALETSIPIHQLFRLAGHLVYWGYGRVIDTITMHNFYQVNPKMSLRTTSSLALEFKRKYPPRELCEVLASFSGARRLGDSVKNMSSMKKLEYIHMLIWLLQRDFIIQLHRYVYFMIPPDQENPGEQDQDPLDDDENFSFSVNGRYRSETRASRTLSRTSAVSESKTPDTTLAKSVQPANTNIVGLTDQERSYLDRIATTNPVYTLFRRLCVYFHGQYHLEEIMWRENVSRSELRTVLSTYQGIIVCCLHE